METWIYYALIPHITERKVLLVEDGSGWDLPLVQGHVHYSDAAGLIRQHLKSELGLDVTVLRWVDYRYDAATETFHFFYALENHRSGPLPAHARWFSQDDLEPSRLARRDDFPIVQAWFAEWEGSPPAQRSPWAHKGWLAEAKEWISGQLARLGETVDGEVEQVKVWQRSCVLRVPTPQGRLYFKAVPDGFRIELALLLDLGHRYPAYAQVILAADLARGWFLMRDLGRGSLFDIPDLAHWERAVATYARIQVDSLSRIDGLWKLGCMDRRIERLPDMLDSLLATGLCVQSQLPGALTPAEIERLSGLVPTLRQDMERLAAFNLPATLDHGDLNPKNIVVAQGGAADSYLVLDWSDCSISHPFFSLRPLLGFLEIVSPDVAYARARVRDAYLAEWESFAPRAVLVEAFEIADRLAPLHMSLSFHLQVLPHLEVKSEWIGTESLFLRWLLDQYNTE